MIAASPLTLASHSGVAPSRLAAFGVRARADQHVDQFLVAAVGRPVQRRRAVGLRRVHIGLLCDQRAHGRLVAAHGRVRDIALARSAPAQPRSATTIAKHRTTATRARASRVS